MNMAFPDAALTALHLRKEQAAPQVLPPHIHLLLRQFSRHACWRACRSGA